MARKKNQQQSKEFTEKQAEVIIQPITETIEKNYMPYVMSVIISRAIPEIDGFKPSHRKLLYTMYKMGLLHGDRTKSTNVVGQTMHLNPHGDASIYETMVRLTRANETLLHPFIDSKGTFGKHYSSDMDYAAPRYTEVRLDSLCNEIFNGIDKNAVDFVDNYDNTTKEPVLLPTAFPNILVSPNIGVAVGMACSICSFNLGEICDGTIQLLKNPNTDTDKLLDIIPAPDFSTGGNIIYDREHFRSIFETGKGNVKIRSRYSYDKDNNCIDILQIPYSTTIELIQKRLTQLVKEGRVKEITDFRDEIDVNGFKLTIDLKRGTDPNKVMAKLFKMTPLEDNFDCNFNVLINGAPQQLGVKGILLEWIKFRVESVKRELTYDLEKKSEKLHLLLGLGKILLDIDKAIKIVRETQKEKDVVPNLMVGFDIDEVQAEYIADIKLRNLNREYIINRIKDIESLQEEIDNLEKTISSETRLKSLISAQLKEIKNKYAKPRCSQLISAEDIVELVEEETVESYPVRLVLTKEGYFKKITMQSLRGSDVQMLKEGDSLFLQYDGNNTEELIFFSDKAQAYKARVADFDTTKASQLGDYIPAKLGFDEGEKVIFMKNLSAYNENAFMVFTFENGKCSRVPMNSYQTKANRRKLVGAYSDSSPIVSAVYTENNEHIVLVSDTNKAMTIKTDLIPVKATRTSQGITVMTLKAKQKVAYASLAADFKYEDPMKYRKIKIPSSGTLLNEFDIKKAQIKLEN